MENISLLKAGEHVEPNISKKSDPLKWLDKEEIGDWNLLESTRKLSLKGGYGNNRERELIQVKK